jgi:hypothetical protein
MPAQPAPYKIEGQGATPADRRKLLADHGFVDANGPGTGDDEVARRRQLQTTRPDGAGLPFYVNDPTREKHSYLTTGHTEYSKLNLHFQDVVNIFAEVPQAEFGYNSMQFFNTRDFPASVSDTFISGADTGGISVPTTRPD